MTERTTARTRLRVFGGLALELGSGRGSLTGNRRKQLALLALLSDAGDAGMRRDKLLALLWPESDDERARNALSQLIFRIRRELGEGAIVDDGALRLDAAVVASDAAEFREAVAAEAVERALELYVGPFLDGFFLSGCAELEHWTATARDRYERMLFDALDKAVAAAEARGEHASALEWRRRRAAAEPLSTQAASAYLNALDESGASAEAVRFARAYCARLRAELEIDAPADIRAFLREPAEDTARSSRSLARETRAPVSISPAGPPRRPRRRTLQAASIGLGAAVLALVVLSLREGRASSRSPSLLPAVLVAPPVVEGATPQLVTAGRIATDWITTAIAQSGLVATIDADEVLLPANSNYTKEDPRWLSDLAAKTNATILVRTTCFQDADSIRLATSIISTRTDQLLAPPVIVSSSVSDIAAGVENLVDRVAGALAALVDPKLTTLADAHGLHPRYAAYEQFIRGMDLYLGRATTTMEVAAAVPYFTAAARLDSTFNLPRFWLAFAFQHDAPRRDSVVSDLERRSSTLLPYERYGLEYFLALRRADNRAALRAVREASRLAPSSEWTWNLGLLAMDLGYGDEAVGALRQLDVDGGWAQNWDEYWYVLVSALHTAGRTREQIDAAHEAAQRMHGQLRAYPQAITLASLGDGDAIVRMVDSLAAAHSMFTSAAILPWYLLDATREAIRHGHDDAAQMIIARGLRWLRENPPRADDHSPAMWPEVLGEFQYLRHDWTNADSAFAEATHHHDAYTSPAYAYRVLVAVRRGDSVAARQRYAEAMSSPEFSADTIEQSWLRWHLAALRGDVAAMANELTAYPDWWEWHTATVVTPELRRSPALKHLFPNGG